MRFSLREWGAAETSILEVSDDAPQPCLDAVRALAWGWTELLHVRAWDAEAGEWVELGESP